MCEFTVAVSQSASLPSGNGSPSLILPAEIGVSRSSLAGLANNLSSTLSNNPLAEFTLFSNAGSGCSRRLKSRRRQCARFGRRMEGECPKLNISRSRIGLRPCHPTPLYLSLLYLPLGDKKKPQPDRHSLRWRYYAPGYHYPSHDH